MIGTPTLCERAISEPRAIWIVGVKAKSAIIKILAPRGDKVACEICESSWGCVIGMAFKARDRLASDCAFDAGTIPREKIILGPLDIGLDFDAKGFVNTAAVGFAGVCLTRSRSFEAPGSGIGAPISAPHKRPRISNVGIVSLPRFLSLW
jgi:hypothetical protein